MVPDRNCNPKSVKLSSVKDLHIQVQQVEAKLKVIIPGEYQMLYIANKKAEDFREAKM